VDRNLTRWLIPLPAILFAVFPQTANAEPTPGLATTYYTVDAIPPVQSTSEYPVCGSETENNINRSYDGEPYNNCTGDLFMVHMVGYISIPEHDTIEFMLAHDDGGEITIGDNTFGGWWDQGCSWTMSDALALDAGSVPLELWMYENGGSTCIMLAWNINNEGWAIVPDEAFTSSSNPTTTTTTTITTTTSTLPETTTTTSTTTSSTTTTTTVTTTSSSTTTLPIETTTTTSTTLAPTTSQTTTTTTTTTTTIPATTTTAQPYTPPQTTTTEPAPIVEPTTTTSTTIETTTTKTTSETTATTTSQPATTEQSTAETIGTTLSDDDQVETETPTTQPTESTTVQTEPTVTTTTYTDSTLLDSDTPVEPIDDQQFDAFVDQINDNTPGEVVAEIVTQLLQYDLTNEQATQLVTDTAVLAVVDEQQAEQLFEQITIEDLTAVVLEVLIDAVQDAPTVVRNAFESKIDIFGGYAEQYVPVGSSVTVSVRRTIVAVSASMAIIATPVPTRRRR